MVKQNPMEMPQIIQSFKRCSGLKYALNRKNRARAIKSRWREYTSVPVVCLHKVRLNAINAVPHNAAIRFRLLSSKGFVVF